MKILDGKKGKKQRQIVTEQRDPNLNGQWWKNDDQAQTHYLVSVLELKTPLKEHPDWRTIESKPMSLTFMPHKYYIARTRDDTPLRGRIVMGREVEGI